jgi:isoamylase
MSAQSITVAGAGTPQPLGASRHGEIINFALFCRNAQRVSLVITTDIDAPPAEFVYDPAFNKTGDIYHLSLHAPHLPLYYGYRVETRDRPQSAILMDPYAHQVAPRRWRQPARFGRAPVCMVDTRPPFDWQDDRPLQTPAEEIVIYELHVRGFTIHGSGAVQYPGTYAGLCEKIGYLKQLGISAVELMPVTEWDENDCPFTHPDTGAPLVNYWGYNPLSFFAPKPGFAADPDNYCNEFKEMVRRLHEAGIEVYLDLVFNHTGEKRDHPFCLYGLAEKTYYLHHPETGEPLDFSGCGNTLNTTHSVVAQLIADALRHWVVEYHIDGFRFDLAAIFARGRSGEIRTDSPLIDLLAEDPLLADTKLIAEAWDAGGAYLVGSFSDSARWREWNGRYRDDVRRFLAGHQGAIAPLATRLAGSSDLYEKGDRGPLTSVNFITCHDGFTLYDLMSYDRKYNRANGEDNRDGENNNISSNSGHEGDPAPPAVRRLRWRKMRTAMALLLFSQGIPMLSAGDEFGKTQGGNNNPWSQDNETGWLDWRFAETNKELLRFVSHCIALRNQYPIFRLDSFFSPIADDLLAERAHITWHGQDPATQDWSDDCRTLAFMLLDPGHNGRDQCAFYLMLNGATDCTAPFIIPETPPFNSKWRWHKIIDTGAAGPGDFVLPAHARPILAGASCTVAPMGLVVLQALPHPLP